MQMKLAGAMIIPFKNTYVGKIIPGIKANCESIKKTPITFSSAINALLIRLFPKKLTLPLGNDASALRDKVASSITILWRKRINKN